MRVYLVNDLGMGSGLRARWGWCAFWLAGFWLASALYGLGQLLMLAMLWSMGWLIGEFVDRRSVAGDKEWKDWEADLEQWRSEAPQRHIDNEARWASPFVTYKLYMDARAERDGTPLTYEQFSKARSGEPVN
jgi:hypothetical protein